MQEAKLWVQSGDDTLQCRACAQFCRLKPGECGICGVRVNHQGVLYTLVADRVAALNVDPIEKKPLFHFQPGSTSLSIGTMGCNFSCTFCQNDALSQTPKRTGRVGGERISPEQLIHSAQQAGCASISYTYSEPTVFFELIQASAGLAVEAGLSNVLVSNGFMSKDCLQALLPVVQGINCDLKAFQDDFYQRYCGGRLKPVLANLQRFKEMGWWLEVTTLIIPGLNDQEQELKAMAGFIQSELGPETPWHLSRFRPCYRMLDRPSTPVFTLEKAYAIGKEAGLAYVYLGNVPGHASESTLCPKCGQTVMDRRGFATRKTGLQAGCCAGCGAGIAGYGL